MRRARDLWVAASTGYWEDDEDEVYRAALAHGQVHVEVPCVQTQVDDAGVQGDIQVREVLSTIIKHPLYTRYTSSLPYIHLYTPVIHV